MSTFNSSEIAILKACALMQYNSEDFFILYDNDELTAYEGTKEDAQEQYNDYAEGRKVDIDSFATWCSENLTAVEGIEDDEERDNYIVLTDEEADEKAAEYIKDSLWAFNASFIIEHSKLPWEAEEMIQAYQEKKCEGANETIEALIEDMDEFIQAAISADGRGHFMSSYDGSEHEETIEGETFYIYRMN